MSFTLIIGNRNYSSWSLRAWLVMKLTGAAFDEVVIPLDQPETHRAILAHSAAGRVPVLRHGDVTVWDSLAIAEYLAELFPGAGLWPAAPARAVIDQFAARWGPEEAARWEEEQQALLAEIEKEEGR